MLLDQYGVYVECCFSRKFIASSFEPIDLGHIAFMNIDYVELLHLFLTTK